LVVQLALGDHRMRSFQGAVIHAVDHCRVDVLSPGAEDDDFLRPGIQVGTGLGLAGKQSGALEHHVHAKLFPGQFGGICAGRRL